MKRGASVITIIGLLLILLFSANCTSSRDFNYHLGSVVKPYRFSTVDWEFQTIIERFKQSFWSHNKKIDNGADIVTNYLTLGNRIKALKAEIGATSSEELQSELNDLQRQRDGLVGTVEMTIKRQIQQTLAQEGIYNPWYKYDKLKLDFPPVNLKLDIPPHLLVISPRDKIETMKTILLDEDLSLEEMAAIEAELDTMNVSSLVVELGGLGTYPSLVENDTSLQSILETAAHEWSHEYLAFTPLGFRYLLNIVGLSHNPDIVTMNETVADIVGKEIAAAIIQKYYPETEIGSPSLIGKPTSDFDKEMRDIRESVDQYLARGEIETAERFMREQRDYLASKGYYIRKLNQAYFAFNGQYADNPAFISPIGMELKQMRAECTSLSDFLDAAALLTSQRALKLTLEQR